MQPNSTLLAALSAAAGAVFLTGCAVMPEPEPGVSEAVAVLQPTEGNSARGTVQFRKVENGVEISAELSGLSPGRHGFHIHELGDCRAPDGTSAGGHYNPWHREHGNATADQRHVGDLGNISADSEGKARYQAVDEVIALTGANNIIGRAVIVHAKPDDFSQPTGAAGARVACGVIAISKR